MLQTKRKTMLTIITNQKKERDVLVARPYLSRRTPYDTDALLSCPQIKLITGPRRTGKSTEAILMLKNKNFAYLNFDDGQLLSAWDENAVWQALQQVYPAFDYLLLDEVQNLDGWDLWVSKLYRNGINLVITGSNAKLLSSEMATLLTGRYIQVSMLPFSIDEFFAWHHLELKQLAPEQTAQAEALQADYLRNGGYPETVISRNIAQSYLSTLFDSIVWKDTAKRHRVRNVSDLNDLAMYMLSNFCNPFSATDLASDLGFSSVATTKKYMEYLREPYLFYYLPRYNNKLKLMAKAPQKVYVVDNGFVTAKAFNLGENLGRLLENMVFVELIRRGYDTEKSLFYYRSRNDKEVDFVVRSGHVVERLVQVCYDMTSAKAAKREINSLIECAGELKCNNLCIVTMGEECVIEERGYTINVIPFIKF